MFFFAKTGDAIAFLVCSVLPFVNASEPLDMAGRLYDAVKVGCNILHTFSCQGSFEQLALLHKQKEISDTHKFIKSALALCLASYETTKDLESRGKIEILPGVEGRIKENLKSIGLKISWKSKGTCMVGLEYDATDTVKAFEMMATCSIINALCSASIFDSGVITRAAEASTGNTRIEARLQPKPDNIDSLTMLCTGEGLDEIGICANCGVFFEKKRKDQIFCSTGCKSVFLTRKMRSKKKK